MSQDKDSRLIEALKEMFPRDWLVHTARQVGAVKRRRDVDIVALFWTLVLGFGVARQRTLAALQRSFVLNGGAMISATAFNNRFHGGLVGLLDAALERALQVSGQTSSSALRGTLARFEDVLALDATLIRLHESLADRWPGTRVNHSPASLKIHVVHSLRDQGVSRIKMTSGKVNDRKGWRRFGPWIKGRLMMMDLGYYCARHFARIEDNEGFFLSRLFGNANPVIVANNRKHRGCPRDIVGYAVRDIAPELHRSVLDVNVAVTYRKRPYGGRKTGRQDTRIWRVIGVRLEGEWRFYITNIMSDMTPEQLVELYRLRWQVELLFKVLRSEYKIAEMPSQRPEAVKALLLCGLLTMLVHQRLIDVVRPEMAREEAINLQRAHAALRIISPVLHYKLMRDLGLIRGDQCLFDYLLFFLRDPNRSRLTQPVFAQSPDFETISQVFA